MNSCLGEKTSKQNLQFIDIQDYPFIFDHVCTFFNQEIAPLYGNQRQTLNKIFMGSDRTCEVLVSTDGKEKLGIIVYKDILTNDFIDLGFTQAFEIKTLAVINSKKNSGRRIASHLLYRIGRKAINLTAKSVYVTVSSAKPESLAFFLKYGFTIAKLSRNHYVEGLDEFFLFHPTPEQLLTLISFELLAEREHQITPIKKFSSEAIEFSMIEKLILKDYFNGKTRIEILDGVNKYLGTSLDLLMIDQTLKSLRQYQLKWQTATPSKLYTILFINPLYESQKLEKKIGYVLVGIQPNGKREVLGTCLAVLHQKCYWEDLLKDLKLQGIETINILCGPPDFKIPDTIKETFSKIRIIYSKALKNWSPESFIPSESGQELVEEIETLSELCTQTDLHQVLSVIH